MTAFFLSALSAGCGVAAAWRYAQIAYFEAPIRHGDIRRIVTRVIVSAWAYALLWSLR